MPGTFHGYLHDRKEHFSVDSTLVAAGFMILAILIVVLLFFGALLIRAS